MFWKGLNPLNAELNPIWHLLALLGGATIVVVSRLRVNVAFGGVYSLRLSCSYKDDVCFKFPISSVVLLCFLRPNREQLKM